MSHLSPFWHILPAGKPATGRWELRFDGRLVGYGLSREGVLQTAAVMADVACAGSVEWESRRVVGPAGVFTWKEVAK